jgi:hypothetical protein
MGSIMQMNSANNKNAGYKRGKELTPNQANNSVERGQAPKSIERVDKKHQPDGQVHVHLKNGRGAINADGSGHDGPKPELTKKEIDFISRIKGFFNIK